VIGDIRFISASANEGGVYDWIRFIGFIKLCTQICKCRYAIAVRDFKKSFRAGVLVFTGKGTSIYGGGDKYFCTQFKLLYSKGLRLIYKFH
jgi:hypothetical protein